MARDIDNAIVYVVDRPPGVVGDIGFNYKINLKKRSQEYNRII